MVSIKMDLLPQTVLCPSKAFRKTKQCSSETLHLAANATDFNGIYPSHCLCLPDVFSSSFQAALEAKMQDLAYSYIFFFLVCRRQIPF